MGGNKLANWTKKLIFREKPAEEETQRIKEKKVSKLKINTNLFLRKYFFIQSKFTSNESSAIPIFNENPFKTFPKS